MFAPPSLNSTVPAGVPMLEVTVAENVTGWPKSDGLADELSPVAVLALMLVKLNAAEDEIPLPLAMTLYGPPGIPFAVNTGDVATPLPLMATLVMITLPGNVPLAPLAGAVSVTRSPETGSPKAPLTVSNKGELKAGVMTVLCGVPLVAEIVKPRDSNAPISTVVLTTRAKPRPR